MFARNLSLWVALSASLGCAVPAAEQEKAPPARQPAAKWYHTPIDLSLVEQKKTIRLDAERAAKVFARSGSRIAADWDKLLPDRPVAAERVDHLPAEEGVTRHVKKPQELESHILGFDAKRVHVVLARHVGGHLRQRYHSVEADLMVERSERVDQLLDLKNFTAPYTRTVRGIVHGDRREKVHETLGPPDATRHTQAVGLLWDYYFGDDVTIEYLYDVSTITPGVPEYIRKRTPDPRVQYREPAASP